MSWPPLLAGLAAATAVVLAVRPVPRASGRARAGRWWPALVPVGVVLVVAGSAVPALLLLLGALAAAGVRALLDARRRRADAARTAERVLETCELVAAELVAGQSPETALRRAAQEWSALGPVAEAAELGGDPAASLAELARTPGASDLRLVAAAWTVAHRTGSGLADALDRVAVALRDRRRPRAWSPRSSRRHERRPGWSRRSRWRCWCWAVATAPGRGRSCWAIQWAWAVSWPAWR